MGCYHHCITIYVHLAGLFVNGCTGTAITGSRPQSHGRGSITTYALNLRSGLRCWAVIPRAIVRDLWPHHRSATRQPLLPSFQHRVRGVTNESPNDSLPLLRWTRRQCPASSKPSRKPNPKKSLYLTASRSAAGSFQIASGLKSAERALQSTVLHHS